MGGKTLTKKEIGFVKDVLKHGNATKAAQENLNMSNYGSAAVTATRLLKNVKVIAKMKEAFSNNELAIYHKKLLDSMQVAYFTFPKDMPDEEIKEHVESNGIKVLNIRQSEKGKLAFYATTDTPAVRGALDMAYKLRGDYEDEKDKAPGAVTINILNFNNNGNNDTV